MKLEVQKLHGDVHDIREDTRHAHKRIDELAVIMSDVRDSCTKVAACVGPLCEDVKTITDSIIRGSLQGLNQQGNAANQMVLLKFMDVLQKLIIALAVIGCFFAIGYYGMKAAGTSGSTQVNIEGQK